MRRVVPIAAAAIVLPWGWLTAASAIFCAGTGKIALFRFPFVQWAEAAPWWRLNGTMTLWVSIAAVIPSLFLLVCGLGLFRARRVGRSEVYGQTEWASRRQMKAGHISASRRPF
jgi:hypothetical protein